MAPGAFAAMSLDLEYRWAREEGRSRGLKEGQILGARNIVLLLGEQRFGPTDQRSSEAIAAIRGLDELKYLAERISSASSWEDLLSRHIDPQPAGSSSPDPGGMPLYDRYLDDERKFGDVEATRRLVLTIGSSPLGPPDETTRAGVAAIKDPAALEWLLMRLFRARSWEELLRLL